MHQHPQYEINNLNHYTENNSKYEKECLVVCSIIIVYNMISAVIMVYLLQPDDGSLND